MLLEQIVLKSYKTNYIIGSISPWRTPGTEPINNFKGTKALSLYNREP